MNLPEGWTEHPDGRITKPGKPATLIVHYVDEDREPRYRVEECVIPVTIDATEFFRFFQDHRSPTES